MIDPEPTVRVELMERIPELAKICIERSEQLSLSSSMVEEEILPLVINYLEDLTNTVRKTAQTSLARILDFFSPQVCHQKILPNIIGLAEKQNDDYRKGREIFSSFPSIYIFMLPSTKCFPTIHKGQKRLLFLQNYRLFWEKKSQEKKFYPDI